MADDVGYCREAMHHVPIVELTYLISTNKPLPGRPAIKRAMCNACKNKILDKRRQVKEMQKSA